MKTPTLTEYTPRSVFAWASSLMAVCLAVGLISVLTSACAPDVSPSPTSSPLPVPSSTLTGGITLITSAGVTAGLNFGITDPAQRAKIAGYIDTAATLTNQLVKGAPITPQAYQAYLTTYGVKNDAQYAGIASTITSLYATFVYPKITASADGPAINAYLLAFSQGLQNGAGVYAPATVIPSVTTTAIWPRSTVPHLHPRLAFVGSTGTK